MLQLPMAPLATHFPPSGLAPTAKYVADLGHERTMPNTALPDGYVGITSDHGRAPGDRERSLTAATPELSRMNRTLRTMNNSRWVDFELPGTAIGRPVSVRIGDFGGRWLAVVTCGADRLEGLGASPRNALLAALAPLGMRASVALMAEPVMFGASAELLARAAI